MKRSNEIFFFLTKLFSTKSIWLTNGIFFFPFFFFLFLVDTREVQPHETTTSEKEQLGLASVKAEPGSTSATTTSTTTGARLLHGILSQHPQQHTLGVQNGYGRHMPTPAGHSQMAQPPYTTAAIATTSTPGNINAL